MDGAAVVVTLVTVAMNVGIAAADLSRAGFVLANAGQLGLPPSMLPGLAALKLAAAAGLVLGLLGIPLVGEAAAIGLVVFYVSAVAVHVREKVLYNLAFPGTFLAAAVATLVLTIAN
ncbi:DoxX family protein [Pseudonocardia sp. TRM90224]|uniref:DoxX family protein n=1 Tax=Pseudonocardia sp. TRM90224 TaxID=2812678 RepID=UPI001E3769EC|nr:DoxX family protein [Pseudonocardia sp. TRM90224]